jgi:hypothetical protein
MKKLIQNPKTPKPQNPWIIHECTNINYLHNHSCGLG